MTDLRDETTLPVVWAGGHRKMGLPTEILLFPKRARIEFPKSKMTADALGEVEAEDGQRYYVKGDTNSCPTRACEWISTHLAETVGISAPTPALIEMLNGDVLFGSRRLSGVADDTLTRLYLLRQPSSNAGSPPVTGLVSVLSAIYAFDMFLFNDDRHFGNYLSQDDSGTRRLYAFDFSRALFWRWPWVGFPDPTANTRRVGTVLRQLHGFDEIVALATLDRLGALAPSALEGFIHLMPPDWLRLDQKAELLSWWTGKERGTRIDELRKGLRDGSLL